MRSLCLTALRTRHCVVFKSSHRPAFKHQTRNHSSTQVSHFSWCTTMVGASAAAHSGARATVGPTASSASPPFSISFCTTTVPSSRKSTRSVPSHSSLSLKVPRTEDCFPAPRAHCELNDEILSLMSAGESTVSFKEEELFAFFSSRPILSHLIPLNIRRHHESHQFVTDTARNVH